MTIGPQNSAHVSEDRLIDLIHGLLDASDDAGTRAHLKWCDLCETHFRMLVAEHETLRTKPAPRVLAGHIVLPDTPTGARDSVTGVVVLRRRRRVRWMSAAAVVAAAALAFIVPNIMKPGTSGALRYWLPGTSSPEMVTEEASELDALREALTAYEAHDTERAARLLAEAPVPAEDVTTDAIRRVYQASALVNEDRAREALVVMDGVSVEDLIEPWKSQALWVRYLALQGAGQDERARELLSRLADAGGDVGDMARQERERLSEE